VARPVGVLGCQDPSLQIAHLDCKGEVVEDALVEAGERGGIQAEILDIRFEKVHEMSIGIVKLKVFHDHVVFCLQMLERKHNAGVVFLSLEDLNVTHHRGESPHQAWPCPLGKEAPRAHATVAQWLPPH
jgi:hypothetical protein